jgi:hypothetical protein
MERRISVEEITSDLQKGIPDKELMHKYRLSENGLKRLFDLFLRAMSTGADHIQVECESSNPDELEACHQSRNNRGAESQ